ncbi:MAG: endonuclease/exonuclease/phosphatase family protein [Bacteroidota bacterium]
MPSFPKPSFTHTVNLPKEIKAVRDYMKSDPALKIPAATSKTLRVATWNIANLGEQDREDAHLKIIAEIISWFDLIAVQETKENYEDFKKIVKFAGTKYKFIFSDAAGNNERLAFIYDSNKVKVLEEVAEYAIPPSDYGDIKITGVTATFNGFDRSPFLVSFAAGSFQFTLMTVHLYYGDDADPKKLGRRCLETYAVARWADLRSKSKYTYNNIKDVFALGDFNLPKINKDDAVYKALVKRGLQLPDHTSLVYSNINNDQQYDQIAFLPGTKSRILSDGVFPFDNAVFADIFNSKTAVAFRGYIKYYISDHRPMWMELDIH